MGSPRKAPIAVSKIEQAILLIRGRRVMLDADLAAFYGIRTAVLKRAVRRNEGRFPPDFMFQLTRDEANAILRIRCQSGTLKRGTHVKYLPYVFTQEGVAMLSSVLRSPKAVQVNVAIMRAFVRLRETLTLHRQLARRLAELERRIEGQDVNIQALFETLRQLTTPPDPPAKRIGFDVRERGVGYRTGRRARDG